MLRPLSTYLLLIIACSFFMMGMKGLHLDNFVKSQSVEITKASSTSGDNCSFIDTTNPIFPVRDISLIIENFEAENEVEEETDVLSTIELTPGYFNLNNQKCLFLNVYSTYSFAITKIDFLDIFSPPPNTNQTYLALK